MISSGLEKMDFAEFGTLQSVTQIPSIRVVCCGDSAIGKSLLMRRLTETQLLVGNGSDNDFATVMYAQLPLLPLCYFISLCSRSIHLRPLTFWWVMFVTRKKIALTSLQLAVPSILWPMDHHHTLFHRSTHRHHHRRRRLTS